MDGQFHSRGGPHRPEFRADNHLRPITFPFPWFLGARRLRVLIVAAAAISVLPWQLTAQTPQAAQEAERLHLQTELPRTPDTKRFTFKLPSESLWLVIAVALGVMLYALRDLLPTWRVRRRAGWTPQGLAAGAAGIDSRAPEVVLSTADELAAKGRFVDAIHVLLLQALATIRQGLDQQFADSLTSREIFRSAKLSNASRKALGHMIYTVERTYFGKLPAAHSDYLDCRASFNALAEALHAGAQG
jgi:hypothetical protein